MLAATFLLGSLLDLPIALATVSDWTLIETASPAACARAGVLDPGVDHPRPCLPEPGARRLDASQVATVGNASPILTVIWGIWLFHEAVTPSLALGGILTLGGIVWTSPQGLRVRPATGNDGLGLLPPSERESGSGSIPFGSRHHARGERVASQRAALTMSRDCSTSSRGSGEGQGGTGADPPSETQARGFGKVAAEHFPEFRGEGERTSAIQVGCINECRMVIPRVAAVDHRKMGISLLEGADEFEETRLGPGRFTPRLKGRGNGGGANRPGSRCSAVSSKIRRT